MKASRDRANEVGACLADGQMERGFYSLSLTSAAAEAPTPSVRPVSEYEPASQPASQECGMAQQLGTHAHARTYITIVLSTNHQTIHLSNLEMAYRDSEWGRVGPRLVSYEYLRRGRHELATSTSTVSLASGTGVCRVSDQTGSSKSTIIFNVRKSQDRGKAKIPQKQG